MSAGRRVRVAGDLFHPRVPDGAVYVGRPAPGLRASRYANPHRAGRPCRSCMDDVVHGQAEAVAAYAHHLDQHHELVTGARDELAGADLACWCPTDTGLCHADVLVLVAAGADPLPALDAALTRAGAALRPSAVASPAAGQPLASELGRDLGR